MDAPDGNSLHYVGWLLSTAGLFPLVSWLAERWQVQERRRQPGDGVGFNEESLPLLAET